MLNRSVSEILVQKGEKFFRDVEEKCISFVTAKKGAVIATGGGCVQRKSNRNILQENARVYYIKRELSLLAKDDRPLSSSQKEIENLFRQRQLLYEQIKDVTIENNLTVESAAKKITEDFYENSCY